MNRSTYATSEWLAVAVWKVELRIPGVVLAWRDEEVPSVIDICVGQGQREGTFAWYVFAHFDSNGRKCQGVMILRANDNQMDAL